MDTCVDTSMRVHVCVETCLAGALGKVELVAVEGGVSCLAAHLLRLLLQVCGSDAGVGVKFTAMKLCFPVNIAAASAAAQHKTAHTTGIKEEERGYRAGAPTAARRAASSAASLAARMRCPSGSSWWKRLPGHSNPRAYQLVWEEDKGQPREGFLVGMEEGGQTRHASDVQRTLHLEVRRHLLHRGLKLVVATLHLPIDFWPVWISLLRLSL